MFLLKQKHAHARICWQIFHWKLEGNVAYAQSVGDLYCVSCPGWPSAHVPAPWMKPFRGAGLWTVLVSNWLFFLFFFSFANDFPARWEWSQGRNLPNQKLVNLSTEKWQADAELPEGHVDFCGWSDTALCWTKGDGASPRKLMAKQFKLKLYYKYSIFFKTCQHILGWLKSYARGLSGHLWIFPLRFLSLIFQFIYKIPKSTPWDEKLHSSVQAPVIALNEIKSGMTLNFLKWSENRFCAVSGVPCDFKEKLKIDFLFQCTELLCFVTITRANVVLWHFTSKNM